MSKPLLKELRSGMERIDLDRFVCEVLELILLNVRGDTVSREDEMR